MRRDNKYLACFLCWYESRCSYSDIMLGLGLGWEFLHQHQLQSSLWLSIFLHQLRRGIRFKTHYSSHITMTFINAPAGIHLDGSTSTGVSLLIMVKHLVLCASPLHYGCWKLEDVCSGFDYKTASFSTLLRCMYIRIWIIKINQSKHNLIPM